MGSVCLSVVGVCGGGGGGGLGKAALGIWDGGGEEDESDGVIKK